MKMTPVTSSNIAAMWYDLEKSELYIKFKNNKKFTYLGVTQEEYGRLINAESIGKHFNQFIKAVKVGREVVTAENDTAENDAAPMSDKEKIKVLREALEAMDFVLSGYEKPPESVRNAISKMEKALEATKDGERCCVYKCTS
jgi:maleate cis-trans isomerase